ncbi:hypothetical protein CDL12_07589 [Handroanthus impetiginosus]|uniref:Bet v I/Major latex protein domain-containing protein n=2 Tax=Handroanthus impetiginosus TaxID=429701 RepID=A0A2G9HQC6_9LAMI|nr:hypothetical protein CDL12_07589 [Handroanthus impetiginosus]
MAQIPKIKAKAEIESSPAKVFDFFKYKLKQFPNIYSQVFKKLESLEGEERIQQGLAPTIFSYGIFLGGQKTIYPKLCVWICTCQSNQTMTAKVRTEAVNEGEKSVTFKTIEGDVMQIYTTFITKVTVGDGYVIWTIEYEKANDTAPIPDNYTTLAAEITKGLDAYLLSQI